MRTIKVSELKNGDKFRYFDLGENHNSELEFISLEWDLMSNRGYNLTYLQCGNLGIKYISANDNIYNESINTEVILLNEL